MDCIVHNSITIESGNVNMRETRLSDKLGRIHEVAR